MSEPKVNELQALVLRRLDELGDDRGPLSIRAAVMRARGGLSYETLRSIARGTHSNKISDETASAISVALDTPLSDVYVAARLRRPESRWMWPARFDRLDLQQRRIVEEVAAGLLEAYEKGLRDR